MKLRSRVLEMRNEPSGEIEMSKLILKVGDQVQVLYKTPAPLPAKIVAITDLPGKTIGVEYTDLIGGHSCDGAGKDKHCKWVLPEHVLSVQEAANLAKVKAVAKPVPVAKSNLVLEVDGSNKVVRPA